MRRAWLALAAVFVAVLAFVPSPDPSAEPGLSWGGGVGGGVTDVATGRQLSLAPEEDSASGALTVLPYRAGATYRVPLVVVLAEHADEVRVTGIKIWRGDGGYVEPAGAVVSPVCCTLHDVRPFAPFTLRHTRDESVAMVGLDLRLAPGAPAGWLEPVRGFEITYRYDGMLWVERMPFSVQELVVTA